MIGYTIRKTIYPFFILFKKYFCFQYKKCGPFCIFLKVSFTLKLMLHSNKNKNTKNTERRQIPTVGMGVTGHAWYTWMFLCGAIYWSKNTLGRQAKPLPAPSLATKLFSRLSNPFIDIILTSIRNIGLHFLYRESSELELHLGMAAWVELVNINLGTVSVAIKLKISTFQINSIPLDVYTINLPLGQFCQPILKCQFWQHYPSL